jgi:hypothetical protein
MRVSQLNPYWGNRLYPINTALKLALEAVAYRMELHSDLSPLSSGNEPPAIREQEDCMMPLLKIIMVAILVLYLYLCIQREKTKSSDLPMFSSFKKSAFNSMIKSRVMYG